MPKGLTYRQYRRRQKKYGLAEVAEAISVSPKVEPTSILGLETLEEAEKLDPEVDTIPDEDDSEDS